MVNLRELTQHESIVQYTREGGIYHDRYYYTRRTQNEALYDVKKDWHRDNDYLFPEAKDAKFFAECE